MEVSDLPLFFSWKYEIGRKGTQRYVRCLLSKIYPMGFLAEVTSMSWL